MLLTEGMASVKSTSNRGLIPWTICVLRDSLRQLHMFNSLLPSCNLLLFFHLDIVLLGPSLGTEHPKADNDDRFNNKMHKHLTSTPINDLHPCMHYSDNHVIFQLSNHKSNIVEPQTADTFTAKVRWPLLGGGRT